MAEVFETELQSLGFSVSRDDWGNVIAVLNLGPGPTVLLDGHLDTVPVPDPEAWTRNPGGEVHKGRIYGRGAVDMKGPLAACVYGAASLSESNLTGTVIISGTVCEELAEGPALAHVIEGLSARGLAPDAVVICEPSANQLILGQRGRAEISVEVFGTACHSAYPEVGVNAAEVMANVIVAVRRLQLPNHPDLGQAILVLTDLKSFPYPSQSMVPERCIATFDRRSIVGESESEILTQLRNLVNPIVARSNAGARVELGKADFTTNTGISVAHGIFASAWLLPADSWPASAAITGLERAQLPASPGYYKFCTNGSASAGSLGIPTLGYGPGDPAKAHTVDESITLDSLSKGAQGYTAIMKAILDGR